MKLNPRRIATAMVVASPLAFLLAACIPDKVPTAIEPTLLEQTCVDGEPFVIFALGADCGGDDPESVETIAYASDGKELSRKILPVEYDTPMNRWGTAVPKGTTKYVVVGECEDIKYKTSFAVSPPDCDSTTDAGGSLSDAAVSDASSADAGAEDAGPSLLGYAYVASQPLSGSGAGQVLQFRALADGTLAPMSPPGVQVGERANRVEVATVGGARFLYATNTGSNTVSQFSVGADGRLTALSPATVSVEGEPDQLRAVGSKLYVVNTQSGTVSQFSIGATGQLTELAPAISTESAGSTGTMPTAICNLGDRMYVGVVGGTRGIAVYSIADTDTDAGVTGSLRRLLPDVAPQSGGYLSLTCSPDATHLYASTTTGVLNQFARTGDTLTPLAPASVAIDFGVSSLLLNRAGTRLFTLNSIDPSLQLFDVAAGAGTLSAMSPASATTSGPAIGAAFDPTGTFFYVADATNIGISAHRVASMASPSVVTPLPTHGLQGMTVIAP